MNCRRAAKVILRWGTTAAAVLIAGLWVGSGRWTCFAFQHYNYNMSSFVPLARGAIVSVGEVFFEFERWDNRLNSTPEWRFGLTPHNRWNSRDVAWNWNSSWCLRIQGSTIICSAPLWAPFLLAAAPASILWRGEIIARRRRRAGLCKKCGYSRDSLAPDAKCPECGTAGSR
jgi:hypothetical protein